MSGSFNTMFALHRSTETDLGGGRWGEVPAKVGEERGRLSPISGSDPLYGQLQTAVTLYRFATRGGADVQMGDRVHHPDGRIVEVRRVARTSSGRRIEAICEDIEDAD